MIPGILSGYLAPRQLTQMLAPEGTFTAQTVDVPDGYFVEVQAVLDGIPGSTGPTGYADTSHGTCSGGPGGYGGKAVRTTAAFKVVGPATLSFYRNSRQFRCDISRDGATENIAYANGGSNGGRGGSGKWEYQIFGDTYKCNTGNRGSTGASGVPQPVGGPIISSILGGSGGDVTITNLTPDSAPFSYEA